MSRTTSREPLLRSAEVAELMNCTVPALYVRRHRGEAPPAIRTGRRSLRWRRADVEQWLDARAEAS